MEHKKISSICFWLCLFETVFMTMTGTVQRIYIKNSEPPLKGHDIQLVCDISQFESQPVSVYNTDSFLTDTTGVVAITACLPSRCTKKSVGSYTFSTDSSHVYINIINLNRTEDQKWWTCAIEKGRKALELIIYTVPQTLNYVNPQRQDQNLAEKEVTLKCITGCSYPKPTFTWLYNESGQSSIPWSLSRSEPESEGGCSDKERQYTSTLNLPKDASFPDKREKTVQFVCSIASFPGLAEPLQTSSSVNIQFAGSPNGPPTIQDFSDSGTLKVIEAVQVTLSCSISGGNPLATLTWSCFNSRSSAITVGKTVTKTVTWTTLRNTDRTCSCHSDHPVAGKQSDSIKVEILYPPTKPSFGISSVTVSNTIDVIRNNSLTVTCNSSGNPVPSYKWTLPTTATRDGSTLSLSSVQREGRYICKVENSMHLTNGSVIPGSDSSSVDVHMLYPPLKPKFTYGSMTGPIISSRSIDVIKDDTFNVACTSDGKPTPTYKWNNLPNRILAVTKISANQTYNCTVRNTMKETVGATRIGSATAILSVGVLYPPRNVDIKYHYGQSSQIKITSLSIIEGNPFTVKCGSNSIPPPSYSWTGKVTSNSETLTVKNTQKYYVGTYTCNVENTMIRSFPNPQTEVKGRNNKSINLQVLYPPRIEDLRNQSAVEGKPFTVSCPVAAGNPSETTYQWNRATNDQTWHSQTFTIKEVSRDDAMIYTCKVHNLMKQTGEQAVTILPDTGKFYLDVRYSASVTNFFITGHKVGTTITKNETEKVTFECLVDSNPGSTILVMYQKNTKVSMADTKVVNYVIKSAMCTDRGVYSCVGFNQYNKDNSSKILNLLVNCTPRPSPSLLPEENVTSTLHTPAVLVFTTLAYPEPDFRWFRWNTSAWMELSNSDEFRIETAALQSNLTIKDVKRMLFGTYKLDVENQIGRYEQIFNLIPEDKPDPPTGFQHLEDTITQSSITVQWKRGFDNGPEQTFVLRYRKATETIWSSIKIADTGVSTMSYTIPNLSSGTEYDVVLFASNKLGNSSETETLRIKTKGEHTPANAALIAGAVCGGLAFAVLVVVIFLLICRFRRNKGKANSQVELSGRARGENQDEDSSDDEVITENAMYVSAGNIGQKKLVDDNVYAKPQKKSAPNADVYAVVDKTKKSGQKKKKPEKKIKATKGDIYENAPEPLSTNDGTYANSAYDENQYEATGAEASKKQKKNKDGLIYADLAFNDQPKGEKKLVIHGLDSMTEYVQVDFTKKADPLPDSDTEDQK